jgi:hypothetical protein
MIDADISSTFSNKLLLTLEPKSGLKNFSPGNVNTIFLIDLEIADAFLSCIKSKFRGLA